MEEAKTDDTQNKVKEGKVEVFLENDDKTFSAFYNPAQEFNRDLSLLGIDTYMNIESFKPKKFNIKDYKYSICEPLAATGLRSIRYYKELDQNRVLKIVASDMDIKAKHMIEKNAKFNDITVNTENSNFEILCSEASKLLYSNPKTFDIIDLDPYGTAVPFLDSAIQSLKNGGLLLVTFTDMPVLCGNYQETCYYKYGSISAKEAFCHEMAKRIALFTISNVASKYKKVVKPVLSINANFYIRLFIIVYESAEECKKSALKHGYLFHCSNCQNRKIVPLAHYQAKKDKNHEIIRFNNLTQPGQCVVCQSQMNLYGPFWISRLHEIEYIEKLEDNLNNSQLKFKDRIKNMIIAIKEELVLENQVFYYDYSKLSKDIHLNCPKISVIKGGLESLSYKLIQSYYDPNLVKTDCPSEILYELLCCYKKSVYSDTYFLNVNENEYRFKILQREIKLNPNFKESENESKVKYLANPLPNWGPKARAKPKKKNEDD